MISRRKQFLPVIGLILLAGFFITSFASYFASRSSLELRLNGRELPLITDSVSSKIQQELVKGLSISSLMASDTFLRDWLLNGEQDSSQLNRYLAEIQRRYQTRSTSVISAKSHIRYRSTGLSTTIRPLQTQDQWYSQLQQNDTDFATQITPDPPENDRTSLFINHKIFDYDHNFIGATDVQLAPNSLSKLLEGYQQRYQTHISLTDKEGLILSDSDPRHQAGADIHTMPGLSSVAKEILSSTDTKTVTFTRDSLIIHLSSQFIPALNSYLLVEQDARADTGRMTKALVINLLFGIFITLLILTLVHSTTNRYKDKLLNMGNDDDKIRRINLRQKIEISHQNKELLRQNSELQDALTEVKQLSGFLPICASCKKIRDDQGYWSQIETYISARSEAEFSHSICPKCAKRLYPELYPA